MKLAACLRKSKGDEVRPYRLPLKRPMMDNDSRMSDSSAPRAHLQIFPQPLNLIEEEVQVAVL